MISKRSTAWLLLPPALAAAGWCWMELAANRFERITGRAFYGLAGFHYSVPEWGFQYHPGGQQIERWVVTIPTVTTLCLLLVTAIVLTVLAPARLTVTIARWAYTLVCAFAFVLLAAWYSLNVTGVFI